MSGTTRNEHPERRALANELHARPFQPVEAPGRMLHLAFLLHPNRAEGTDRAHLLALIDHFAGPHPPPGAQHYSAEFGRFQVKWERHTEFVSYTLYESGPVERLFAAELERHLPDGWLAAAPGEVIAAVQVELLRAPDQQAADDLMLGRIDKSFVSESTACSRAIDGQAVIVGDFRIHEGGYTRFALILHGEAGPRRLGRISQRLIEIEVYRTLAMLTLPMARRTNRRLSEIETDLARLIGAVASAPGVRGEDALLSDLTALSAEIEALAAETAYRISAARAYEAIVDERIQIIGEHRHHGRQTFGEFMARRFAPAMRTIRAAERRLDSLAIRASRIAELLRTRVSVALEAQNQELLSSMDRRAALHLRLQETVEGLSVVAISYYAVSLAAYVLDPVSAMTGIAKGWLVAGVTVPVVLLVWALVRRMRRRLSA